MAKGTMSEGELLGLFRRELGLEKPHALNLAGNTDDAALLPLAAVRSGSRWSTDDCLVLTQDGMVEGVHFRLDYFSPAQVAWKCAAVNLSDIAAMGGVPLGALVYLGLPAKHAAEDFARGLAQGLKRSMRRFNYTIFGGDVTAARDLTLSIAMAGKVQRSRALMRSGAQPGDSVLVSGRLGLASLGLKLLERKREGGKGAADVLMGFPQAVKRQLEPMPRLNLVELLSMKGFATSCIDLSDSLAKSLRLLAEESRVGIEVELSESVLHPEVRHFYRATRRADAPRLALAAEEDFELLFTVPSEHISRSRKLMRRGTIELGRVVEQPGVWSLDRGKRTPVEELGFEHFGR
jgi:thiamine-monophosphate kinase